MAWSDRDERMLFIQVFPQRECPIILCLWLPHISVFFREFSRSIPHTGFQLAFIALTEVAYALATVRLRSDPSFWISSITDGTSSYSFASASLPSAIPIPSTRLCFYSPCSFVIRLSCHSSSPGSSPRR